MRAVGFHAICHIRSAHSSLVSCTRSDNLAEVLVGMWDRELCAWVCMTLCVLLKTCPVYEHHINWAIPQIIHTSLHKSTTLENTSWHIMSLLRTHCHHRRVEYWDYLSHFASDFRAAPRWRIPQTIPQIIRMAFHKLSTRNESFRKILSRTSLEVQSNCLWNALWN